MGRISRRVPLCSQIAVSWLPEGGQNRLSATIEDIFRRHLPGRSAMATRASSGVRRSSEGLNERLSARFSQGSSQGLERSSLLWQRSALAVRSALALASAGAARRESQSTRDSADVENADESNPCITPEDSGIPQQDRQELALTTATQVAASSSTMLPPPAELPSPQGASSKSGGNRLMVRV